MISKRSFMIMMQTQASKVKSPLFLKQWAFDILSLFEQQTGADCRIRTDDLPLTRRLLYQLS